jgi:membrane-bound lytic murein transglycosylase D
MPGLEDELVHKWEQWYASRPDYVRRMTERGSPLPVPHRRGGRARGMPSELALLPFIESAFNPQAMSPPGLRHVAVHARHRADFELRRTCSATTGATCWPPPGGAGLPAAAAHDVRRLAPGAGRLQLGPGQRAARHQATARRPAADYASLRMPDETRNYVPKLQAVKQHHGQARALCAGAAAAGEPPVLPQRADRTRHRRGAGCALAGMPLESSSSSTRSMNKPVILAAGTPQVLLPYDNATASCRRWPRRTRPLASWTAWVAPRTLKPAEAARKWA